MIDSLYGQAILLSVIYLVLGWIIRRWAFSLCDTLHLIIKTAFFTVLASLFLFFLTAAYLFGIDNMIVLIVIFGSSVFLPVEASIWAVINFRRENEAAGIIQIIRQELNDYN